MALTGRDESDIAFFPDAFRCRRIIRCEKTISRAPRSPGVRSRSLVLISIDVAAQPPNGTIIYAHDNATTEF
jgi:hypothetical protein